MSITHLIRLPSVRLIGAVAALAAIAGAAFAAGPYDVNVVLPLTGNAAFVGQGQKDTLSALADQINSTGGIGGSNLNFAFHDDQSQPQVAVQLTNQALGSKPAVVMGSSLVAMCLAMAPLMTNGP